MPRGGEPEARGGQGTPSHVHVVSVRVILSPYRQSPRAVVWRSVYQETLKLLRRSGGDTWGARWEKPLGLCREGQVHAHRGMVRLAEKTAWAKALRRDPDWLVCGGQMLPGWAPQETESGPRAMGLREVRAEGGEGLSAVRGLVPAQPRQVQLAEHLCRQCRHCPGPC